MRVPLSFPTSSAAERRCLLDALEWNQFSRGRHVEMFERRFLDFAIPGHGRGERPLAYAYATSSGTSALHALVESVEHSEGDTVACPAVTYGATLNAITAAGLRAQIFDIDPVTWGISRSDFEARVGPHVCAAINVHLYGVMNPFDVPCPVIEDAAEAMFCLGSDGATVPGSGTHGAAFSFYGNKIVTTGEGGMVVTESREVFEAVRRFCGQGQGEERYVHVSHGMNYRMSELQGAAGVAQLLSISTTMERRREWWNLYERLLPEIGVAPRRSHDGSAVSPWLMVGILPEYAPDVSVVMSRMAEFGVETRRMFCPLYRMPTFKAGRHWAVGNFPVSEWLYRKAIVLPLFPGLGAHGVEYVVRKLKESM